MPKYFEDTEIYQAHYANEVAYPKLVMLETSSFCNLRCPMCPRTIGKSPSAGASGTEFGNMKMDLLDRLDSLFRNTRSVVLSWFGEPLINKQLPEIVRRIKTYNLSVHITSNGMLLTDKMAEELVRSGLDHMAISMDAATPETYQHLREGAELEVVKANIKRLNQIKRRLGSATPHLQVAFVVMPENVLQLPAMVRLVHELDIHQFTIGPLDDFALRQEFDLASKETIGAHERARQAFEEARQLAQQLGIVIGLESPARFYHEMGNPPPEFAIEDRFFRTDYTSAQTTELGLRKGCGVPWLDTVIGYNGDVHPCCVSGRILGNVYEKSFEEIWWGAAYRAFRAALKSTRAPSECQACRRAHWNSSHPLDQVGDAMIVGQREVHGMGWTSIQTDSSGRPYRQIEREATLFLQYRGQRYLDLELSTLAPIETPCQVRVNDLALNAFPVRAGGWRHYYLRLPPLGSTEFVKVKIGGLIPAQILIRAVYLRERDMRTWRERLVMHIPFVSLAGMWRVVKRVVVQRAPRLAHIYRQVRQRNSIQVFPK